MRFVGKKKYVRGGGEGGVGEWGRGHKVLRKSQRSMFRGQTMDFICHAFTNIKTLIRLTAVVITSHVRT